jgi:hypothetical protein
MIQSAIVSKMLSIREELRLAQYKPADPKRKNYLLQRLLQLENEARAMSFNEDELKSGEIAVGPGKDVVSRQYYVPLPSWVADSGKK